MISMQLKNSPEPTTKSEGTCDCFVATSGHPSRWTNLETQMLCVVSKTLCNYVPMSSCNHRWSTHVHVTYSPDFTCLYMSVHTSKLWINLLFCWYGNSLRMNLAGFGHPVNLNREPLSPNMNLPIWSQNVPKMLKSPTKPCFLRVFHIRGKGFTTKFGCKTHQRFAVLRTETNGLQGAATKTTQPHGGTWVCRKIENPTIHRPITINLCSSSFSLLELPFSGYTRFRHQLGYSSQFNKYEIYLNIIKPLYFSWFYHYIPIKYPLKPRFPFR